MLPERLEDDLFRYCGYCGADCHEDDPEHAADCPFSTGVFEVRPEAHNEPCRFCGFYDDPPMFCSECKEPLYLGDHYTYRQLEDGEPIYEPICLGCSAQAAVIE